MLHSRYTKSLVCYLALFWISTVPQLSLANICDHAFYSVSPLEVDEEVLITVISKALNEGILDLSWLLDSYRDLRLDDLIEELEKELKGIPLAATLKQLTGLDKLRDAAINRLEELAKEKGTEREKQNKDEEETGRMLIFRQDSGPEAFRPENNIVGRFHGRVTNQYFSDSGWSEDIPEWLNWFYEDNNLNGDKSYRVYVWDKQIRIDDIENRKIYSTIQLPERSLGMAHIFSVGDDATLWVPTLNGILVYQLTTSELVQRIPLEGTLMSPFWLDQTRNTEHSIYGERLSFLTSEGFVYIVNGKTFEVLFEKKLEEIPQGFCYSSTEEKLLLHYPSQNKTLEVDLGSLKIKENAQTPSDHPGESYLFSFELDGEWHVLSERAIKDGKHNWIVTDILNVLSGQVVGTIPMRISHSSYVYIRRSPKNPEQVYFTSHPETTESPTYDSLRPHRHIFWVLSKRNGVSKSRPLDKPD